MNESSAASLTLVGTVHRDRRGEARLLQLLERLSPGQLTLEMSLWALRYRQVHSRPQLLRLEHILDRLSAELGLDRAALEERPAIAGIRRLLELPFEYRVAAAYAAGAHIPLSLIDLSEVSAAKLKKVETELITYRNIRVLVNLTEEAGPGDESYLLARSLVLENPPAGRRHSFLEGRRGGEGIGPRDRKMSREIRGLLDARPGEELVHIGGWVHLVEDGKGETLYSLLLDLAPRRLLLD